MNKQAFNFGTGVFYKLVNIINLFIGFTLHANLLISLSRAAL